jgi:hypothetical protein
VQGEHGESSVAKLAPLANVAGMIGAKTASTNEDSPHKARNCGQKLRRDTVNKFVSTYFKFSENSSRILIEIAENREQGIQACLLG